MRYTLIDEINVELKNKLHKERFTKTPVNKRIITLPQCLRSLKCPAKLDAHVGLKCISCGLCQLSDFIKEAEGLGYHVFIMPGGTFVKRVMKRVKPHAVLGVACFADLSEGMKIAASYGLAVQGVLLSRAGCVETDVNWELVREKMYLGLKRPKKQKKN